MTCGLGPYNFEFMTDVTKEIVSALSGGRHLHQSLVGSGMCYCEHCQHELQEAFSGWICRARTNPQDPARRQYIVWQQQRLFELWRLWDGEIRKINPDAASSRTPAAARLAALDMKTHRRTGADAVRRPAGAQRREPPWANGKNGKEYRATMGRKPIGGIFSVGVEEPYRWKDSVQNGAEIRLWAVDGVAQGLRPWFTKFNGTARATTRWLKPVEELYVWHWKQRAVSAQRASRWREWGWSIRSRPRRFHRRRPRWRTTRCGCYQALIEARIPFEMVHDGLLDAGALGALQDADPAEHRGALGRAVRADPRVRASRAAAIVATHETSLYDEWGERRPNFGLARSVRRAPSPATRSQRHAERLSSTRMRPQAPAARGLGGRGRVHHGVQRVEIRNDRCVTPRR